MVAMRMGLLFLSLSSSLGLAAIEKQTGALFLGGAAPAAPARELAAACDAQALARPAAVGAMARDTSYLVRSCGGFKGGTFSARLLNPNNEAIAVYLGVGAAQCGASCVASLFL